MKPFRIALAALALLAGPALAKAPAPTPAPTPTATTTTARPALWVVKDADTTIYLFGTIHVLQPGLTWFDGAVQRAFAASDELKLEMVLPAQAVAAASAMKAGTATDGRTLPSRLPEEARATYFKRLGELNLPPTALDAYQPWFAANNLVLLPLMKLGYAPGSGAEQVLTAAATAAGKPISGFETLDQQLGYFTGLTEAAQVAYLTGVLDEIPTLPATVDAMVGAWRKGDPDTLAKVLNDDIDSNPELARVLLAERNARWADQLQARMARPGTLFVAVGAGHLAGKGSLQELLAERGLKATRVTR